MENNLRELRKQANLTQADLAKMLGITQNNYSYWETGKVRIDNDSLNKLAKILNTSVDYILKRTNNRATVFKLRVLGKIPAGIPFEAIEDIEGYIDINPKFADQSEYFALRVKGDSMSPRILDGDVVVVKKQDDADTGDVCVVMVNGYDATLKTIKKEESGIFLIPTNQAYETKFYSNADIQSLPVRIIGKVVELRGNI